MARARETPEVAPNHVMPAFTPLPGRAMAGGHVEQLHYVESAPFCRAPFHRFGLT